MDVRRDPVGQLLAGQRLGIGVAAGAEDGHEQLRLPDLAGVRVDDGQGLAGEVDEQLLARTVLLAHDHVEAALPAPVGRAEPGVLVAVGVGRLVFHPEQGERDAGPPQLAVDQGPVGQRPQRPHRRGCHRGEQPGLHLRVVHVVGQRPAEAGRPRPDEVVGHGRVGQPGGRADLAAAQALAQGEAEDTRGSCAWRNGGVAPASCPRTDDRPGHDGGPWRPHLSALTASPGG